MFSYHDIQMAISLLRLPKDGSQANLQAREKASHVLLNAASAFRAFSNLRPESNVAEYLRAAAAEFEITASM